VPGVLSMTSAGCVLHDKEEVITTLVITESVTLVSEFAKEKKRLLSSLVGKVGFIDYITFITHLPLFRRLC
jgi:hypothetical protein